MSHLALVMITVLAIQAGAGVASTITPTSAAESSEPQESDKGVRIRPVPREQRAPVAYESPIGGIFFKASVAGRDVWAILDTGATYSAMDIELARVAGLKIDAHEMPVRTPRGELTAQQVSNVHILIPGQFEAHYRQLATLDLGAISAAAGRNVEFMLGRDFLTLLVLLVDPNKRNFQFAPSGAFKASPRLTTINLQHKRFPQIEVLIGKEKALVSIDTGFNGQLDLTPAAWARVKPDGASTSTVFSSGAEGKTYAKRTVLVPAVEIETIRLTDVEVGESPLPGEADGILGMGILGKFRFVLDIGKGRLWLHPIARPSSSDE